MPDADETGLIHYSVTFLEMSTRPSYPRPSAVFSDPVMLIAAEDPPPWYFLALYGAVGEEHEWTDWFRRPREKLEAFVGDPKISLLTLIQRGWPAGFFMLDTREEGVCDLAYFGIVPAAQGRGLGRYLLKTAIHTAWDIEGVARLTLNTNTLDHPAALSLYQKCGFIPIRREDHTREPGKLPQEDRHA